MLNIIFDMNLKSNERDKNDKRKNLSRYNIIQKESCELKLLPGISLVFFEEFDFF